MSTQISVPAMALAARTHLALVKASDHRLWRYGAGVYLPDGQAEAESYLLDELGAEARSAHVHELRTLLGAGRVGMDLAAANLPDYLNVRNGLYEWETGELHPHTPHHFYTYQVPHLWKPGATCPRIDAFLERALPDEGERDLFWQWASYCLVPGNRLKRALLLQGRKDAGKTVAIHILKTLLGAGNVSSVSLQDIGDNRFASAELVGKLANIADDLSDTSVKASGRFKAITGNGSVMCERKGKDGFSAVIGAKLIFTANDLPGTGDMSDAYFGRWHVLKFENVVEQGQQDAGIWEAVTSPEEMEGALQRAVATPPGQHGFRVPASVVAAGAAYQSDADSVFGWLDQQCTRDEGAWTERGALYAAFTRWAEGERRAVMKAPTFYNRLRNADVGEAKRRGANGFRCATLVPALNF